MNEHQYILLKQKIAKKQEQKQKRIDEIANIDEELKVWEKDIKSYVPTEAVKPEKAPVSEAAQTFADGVLQANKDIDEPTEKKPYRPKPARRNKHPRKVKDIGDDARAKIEAEAMEQAENSLKSTEHTTTPV